MKPLPFILLLAALTACAPAARPDVQTASVNGITVEVSNFRVDGTQATLDICHQFPDARDWTIWKTSVKADQTKIQELEFSLIELRKPAVNGQQEVITLYDEFVEPDENNGLGLRCDALTVRGVPADAKSITLTIESIAAYPHEGGFCEEEYLNRVNAELDKYDPDLEAGCFEGSGISGLKLISWPASMEEWEAQNILSSEEVFMNIQGIRGPWTFTYEIK